MKRIRLFIINSLILTGTSLLLNGLSVWFNIYISNKLGSRGMGIFQLIFSVYTFAVTLASSGIYLAATRMVAEELSACETKSEKYCGGVHRAMRRCTFYSLCFGIFAGALLFYCSPIIGEQVLHCTETIRPLCVMALSMPMLSISCALNGYFTAVRRVAKTAVTQIFEQFCKIMLTVSCLTLFAPHGLESACLVIALSGVIAETLSFGLEFLFYFFDSRRYQDGKSVCKNMTGKLLHIALPVALSSYLRSGLMTVKNLLVPSRLMAGGISASAALSMFGAVHGVALPIILFPAALLNSVSGLIVPEIAQSHSSKRNITSMINRMFTLNLIVSLGVCGVLFAFSGEIGAAISQNPDVGIYIRLLAPVVPIMYLDTAVDSMLKGLDEQVSVMKYNVYDAFISLLIVWILLPILGIKGYILMICISEVFNFALSFRRLVMVTHFEVDPVEQLAMPLICSAIAAISTHTLLISGFFPILSTAMQAVFTVGLTGIFYLILLLVSGLLTRRSIKI